MSASSRAAFARLSNMVAEQERKKTANVERATAGIDPVLRQDIMRAARADAEYVEANARAWIAGMLSATLERCGREHRTFPRMRMGFLSNDRGETRPVGRNIVPAELLDGAKESYRELVVGISRAITVVRRKTSAGDVS